MYFSLGGAAKMSGIWLVTGPPGVGKSTAVSKVILKLMSSGVIVGGCSTLERRSGGVRVGFDVRDLTSGRTGELASTSSKFGPRVGRYRVNLTDLASVGAGGLDAASSSSEVIVIDEVGPMELVSPEFRRAVQKCIDSGKPILAVVHERLEDDLLNELRGSATETFSMTVENRDSVTDEIGSKLLKAAGGTKIV
jgi:nucleoside-triphosphatase